MVFVKLENVSTYASMMYISDRLWEKVQLRGIDNSVIQRKKRLRVEILDFDFFFLHFYNL